MIKIVVCTTPIRPVPTEYPPFGSLAIIQALRAKGHDAIFFDIDGLRPSFSDVIERLRAEEPDILGISAVVSTAYEYVKRLCLAVRKVLPDVRIVLGGNLAASAELLHRFCGIDVCVIGEGERIIVNLVDYYTRYSRRHDYSALGQIKGITYLAPGGEMNFTGYETAIPPGELLDPDFSILEKYSNIGNFIADLYPGGDFARDPRSSEPHRMGKKLATVVSTKGCVARCTFCHRWDKGFRQVPPEKVIRRVKYLIDRYNVGFIQFGDENFGSDLNATDELIRLIKPLDILWRVGGIRAHLIDLEHLKRMHDAGCVALYYGFESGSDDILQVMEKKLDLSDNLHAARCTYEAGLYTIYQLVLGMPGETSETVSDTIKMVKSVTEFLPAPPTEHLSVNYIQALPGTPVYEYARAKGLIGSRLEDEEEYLLAISDIDAADDTKFLNFTAHPYLTVRTWRARLLYETTVHWHLSRRKRNPTPLNQTIADVEDYRRGGYFNRHNLSSKPLVLILFYPIRWLPIWLWTLWSEYRRCPLKLFLSHVWEWLTWDFKKHEALVDHRSLRHIMRDIAPEPLNPSEKHMIPMRLGR